MLLVKTHNNEDYLGKYELVDDVFNLVRIIIEQYTPNVNELPKITIFDSGKEYVISFNMNLVGWAVSDLEGNYYSPSVLKKYDLLVLLTYVARASSNDEKFNPEDAMYQDINMVKFIETKMLIRGFVNTIFGSENTK